MRTHTRSLAVLATVAFGVSALAGCSAAAPQTVDEACTVVADGMQELESEFAGLSDDLQSGDMSAVSTALTAMQDKLAELKPKVTNEEVSAVITDMHGALEDFNGAVDGSENLLELAGDEDFQAAGETMASSGQAYSELCN